ncbi:ATP-dependent RecD-like DNA helicase [Candidatus Aerophobetes bacterium]|nr:ATP-dependent RecD-like DNA helicase [Candidatus Aerophobetes bacterium]
MQIMKATLERIIFYNEQNGYLVAKCSQLEKEDDTFTIVGNIIQPAPGMLLQIEGEWTVHPKYGRQFKLQSYIKMQPATKKGIERYLGSGIIEKIGPTLAARIVKFFGEDSLKIIEQNPDRLKEVEGIGSKRKANILSAWSKQNKTKQVMLYLYSLRIGPSTANKIYSTYQDEAPQKIQENPYCLIKDIFGIGFKKADSIAEDAGIKKDSPLRIKAGIHHTLMQSTEQGHAYLPCKEVKEKAARLLGIQEALLEKNLSELQQKQEIIIEDGAVYHPELYLAEIEVAKKLDEILKTKKKTPPPGWQNIIDFLEKEEKIKLSLNQKEAIKTALCEKLMVLTGGPGTGKTTTVKSIALLFENFNLKVILTAPTGRAAKRLSEATGRKASTIHRLLGYTPHHGFIKNEKNKLRADVVIVDEVSMVDILLMKALLKALHSSCRLILVGDADQLPAVGPGNLLQDIIQSKVVNVVKLEEIFRQAKSSLIVVNAHRINKGQFPYLPSLRLTSQNKDATKDFYFWEEPDAEKAERIAIELYCKKIPEEFAFNPFTDIQAISPLYKGMAGVNRLNKILQKILNPNTSCITRGQTLFKVGDKVMQLKNNYEKDVFNGDIGVIERINSGEETILVNFLEKKVLYRGQDLNELTVAYAVSVHKSQGSEYPAIIMPVLMSHYIMLQRNLLYTALTRAKKLAIFIGDKKALAIAIRNDKVARRYTNLAQRLCQNARVNKSVDRG